MATFTFCPDRNVPENLPRDAPTTAMTMNGWQFAARPTTPYQRKVKLTLYGLRWYTLDDGTYDAVTNVNFNARALERFYEEHETWKPFDFNHQHFGLGQYRFFTPITVPAGEVSSGGMIKSLEITLIAHNPGY